MNEIREFLQELQHELKTQEKDIQANPRFWVVAQYEYQPCWEEQADKHEFSDGESSYNFDELKEILKDSNYFDENGNCKRTLKDWEDIEDFNFDDIHNYDDLPENIKEDFYEVPMKMVHVIKQNTFFLTKRECQEHIQRNNYHYNDTVHTYAMTAWRSPQVEKLVKILTNTDWSSL